jgi:hypothetical protein
MYKFATFLAAAALATTSSVSAFTPFDPNQAEIRTLTRMEVQFCKVETTEEVKVAVDVVYIYDESNNEEVIEPGVNVEGGPPVEYGCTLIDSHSTGAPVSGTLMTFGANPGPIDQMMYSAQMQSGKNAYALGDWVRAAAWNTRGTRYKVISFLTQDAEGDNTQYDITFQRRAADIKVLRTVDTKDWVAVHVEDQVTIMRITEFTADGVYNFTLYYTGTPNVE